MSDSLNQSTASQPAHIEFPDHLPVSAHREDIAAALAALTGEAHPLTTQEGW